MNLLFLLLFWPLTLLSFVVKNNLLMTFLHIKEDNRITEFKKLEGKLIYRGVDKFPKVALTFDADMTYGMRQKLLSGEIKSYYNKPIVDILEKEKVPATIFVTGLWAQAYPEITKQLARSPLFEIGNHSYSHKSFTWRCYNLPILVTQKEKEEEFSKSQEAIKSIIGYAPVLFRFPGGCSSLQDIETSKKYGLAVVGWDVVSRDAFNNNKQQIVSAVERQVKNGSIIVMHFNGNKNAPQTANALPEIIDNLRSRGFHFVKVSEILRDLEIYAQP